MTSPIILSRVPFRLPLGGGSTDLPSYYERYGGFVFAVAINIYMDIFIKKPVSDDLVHMHYMKYESEPSAVLIKHTIGREALKMMEIKNKLLVSFNADTPSGTGLGSSGACSVGLLKALAAYKGIKMTNKEAAEQSFVLTRRLELPDGKQDPYVCALGGFVVLEIDKEGIVGIDKPKIASRIVNDFFGNTLFFYTGIRRDSEPLLVSQNRENVLELKHRIKEIGREIYQCFLEGNLDKFGLLMNEHWDIKKMMASEMTNVWLDEIYMTAKEGGAFGGKIMGAGGGGYFMFYCGQNKENVRLALQKYNMREMDFRVDELGARTRVIEL